MGLEEYLESSNDLIKVDEGQLIIAEQMRNKLIEFETTKKEIESKEKELKKQLEEVMRANNITGYESNDKRIKISLGEDGITETIDKDRLFLEKPDIFREYVKESPRKGTLRITIREAQDE